MKAAPHPRGAPPPEEQGAGSRFIENRFSFLLVFLSLLLVINPLLRRALGDYLGDYTEHLFFIAILLSGLRSIRCNRVLFRVALAFAVLSVVISMEDLFVNMVGLSVSIYTVNAAFVGMTCIGILNHILRRKRVHADTVMGGVCVYLLIGMLWAFLYSVIELLSPGSFHFAAARPAVPSEIIIPLSYFSYSALTTMGFGDIVPVSESARGFAVLEGICGQVFLAVFIARLLGLHIAAGAASPEE